jgi:hypothetical protein
MAKSLKIETHIETIEELALKTHQGIKYLLIANVQKLDYKHKIKIEIESDSYPRQSYGRGYVWNKNDLKWNLVYDLPYQEMESDSKNRFKDSITAQMFIIDKNKIFDLLIKIIYNE